MVAQSYHFQIERPSKYNETWTWNRSLALELNCRGGKRSNAIILSTKTNFRLVVSTKFMHLEDLPCLGKQVKRLIIKEASKAKAILQSIIWSKERSCNTRFVLVAQNLFDRNTIDAPLHVYSFSLAPTSLSPSLFIWTLEALSSMVTSCSTAQQ